MLNRAGALGALIAAVAAPCCFPIFAAIAATMGLGILSRYEQTVLYVLQGFTLLSFIGLVLAYKSHRQLVPLLIGAAASVLLAFAFYIHYSVIALYVGLAGLLAAAIWNWISSRGRVAPILQSVITCPNCGHRAEETMPTKACIFFYDCPNCQARLKPKPGDCCVFCSYGTVPCPPIQIGQSCCA